MKAERKSFGEDYTEFDLHGYSCQLAEETMIGAFSQPVHINVQTEESKAKLEQHYFTFVIGRGKHSNTKMAVDLSKAVADGLRQAGLQESRHACKDERGTFKIIADKDIATKVLKVYPVMDIQVAEASDVSSDDEESVEKELERLQELTKESLTLRGLSHAIVETRCLAGNLTEDQKLYLGHDLSEVFKTLFEAFRKEIESPTFVCTEEDKEAAMELLQLELNRAKVLPHISDLQQRLQKIEPSEPGPVLKERRKALKMRQKQLDELEDVWDRSSHGRFKFPSVEAMTKHSNRMEEVRKEIDSINERIDYLLDFKE
ncbi:hypothetical protein Pmar_PMAR024671 [Perkinsus marinus ATCC 50983]|uniref:Uncharacterized protein n=1 Tax=Perkinsus marinus (strain ATCC 50983 / TXsc) TaxID=423536 RepID=C5M1B0_PERM5|nr:hypothetical protein Pmar_PMAR024671 [Perkinsus marinus ATCC 50983]EEQ97232.1 hypothetical protein Pmar_PMAR024671 [Perkinsus marinus ATCC 50983]|eukprot:XP_002764515.1 hypothetical protein Pmar_PMAR024671 [Perkinsus marinus ATCC 50983]